VPRAAITALLDRFTTFFKGSRPQGSSSANEERDLLTDGAFRTRRRCPRAPSPSQTVMVLTQDEFISACPDLLQVFATRPSPSRLHTASSHRVFPPRRLCFSVWHLAHRSLPCASRNDKFLQATKWTQVRAWS
jgi:hypothetical protein